MYSQYFILILIVYGTTAQEAENVTFEPDDAIPKTTNISLVPTNTTDATDFYYEEEEAVPKERKSFKDETGGETDTAEATDLTNTTLVDTNGTQATNETTTTPAPKVPCRNETEWTCHDFGCINKENICDGVVDCEDGSDEYRETCKVQGEGERRQLFGLILHCSSFWTYHKKVCPEICFKEPEYCYYALNAENGEEGTCEFPEFPKHGWYTVEPNTTDSSDQPAFRLRYNCSEPYVLVEDANFECRNGKWENENATRYCSEACLVVKRDNFTYECPINRDSNSNRCGNYVAINTMVTVRRTASESDEQTDKISVTLKCKENKDFNITTVCVREIDDEQNNFEKPTMEKMTHYETSFNHMKSNDTKHDSNFNNLVNEFHAFEAEVKAKLSSMHRKAEQCDILLDLLLLDLEDKQKAKAASTANPLA